MSVGPVVRTTLSLALLAGGSTVLAAPDSDAATPRRGDARGPAVPTLTVPSRQDVLRTVAPTPSILEQTAGSFFPAGISRFPVTLHYIGNLCDNAIVIHTPQQLTVQVGKTTLTAQPDPSNPQHIVMQWDPHDPPRAATVTTLPDGSVDTRTLDGKYEFTLKKLPDGRLDAAAHGLTPFGWAHIYFPPVSPK